jgi:hypothetical protein
MARSGGPLEPPSGGQWEVGLAWRWRRLRDGVPYRSMRGRCAMAEPLAAQPTATPQPAVHRVAVIFNPATSPDDAPERKRDLQAALDAAGVEVVWLETTEQEAG